MYVCVCLGVFTWKRCLTDKQVRATAPAARSTAFPLNPSDADLDESRITDYLPFPPMQTLRRLLDEWSPDDVRACAV